MTSQQAVLYVQRNGLYYLDNAKNKHVLHYNFLPSAISDLDIIDSKVLTESIKLFITDNKLAAKECILIVSESVYFEKDYIGIAKEQEQQAIQLFVDSVPFENVLTKTCLIENGIKIVVANKDFCLALKNAFDSNGLLVSAITPAVIIGAKENDDITTTFSLFFDKYDFLKQNNFPLQTLLQEKNTIFQQSVKTNAAPKQSNKRVIFLIVFFLLLVFFLIGMILSGASS